MEKDVTASAVAELWAGAPSAEANFVYVYIGTGIGAGLVLNDEVVRGSSGNVGEIGHIITDPDGPWCDCGRRGCVKVTCMPETIVAMVRAAGVLPAADPLSGATLLDELAVVAGFAAQGEPGAVWLLDMSARRMAGAVSVLTNLLDVEGVVLGGPFGPYWHPTTWPLFPGCWRS